MADVDLDDGARAALDSCAGRTLSDEEWTRAQTKLIEYITVLRSWDNPSSGAVSLEVSCQPES
jgi:hypothetical protein